MSIRDLRRFMNRARTSLANAFKSSESGLVAVLQRTDGITAEQSRLGRKISHRLTSKPLYGSSEMKEKLTGKFVEEPVRLVVPSKETAKMITEGIIKTKLHVAVCSGVNATDSTDAMRPWGFDRLALEKRNNSITSVERIPCTITDDKVVVTWMEAFVAAAAADEAAVSFTHHRWTKDGGGAFEVAPVNARRSLLSSRHLDSTKHATQLGSTQLGSTQLNSTWLTQLGSSQLGSTQLHSTRLNSTQLNSTQLNSTQESSSTSLGTSFLDIVTNRLSRTIAQPKEEIN